MKLVVLFDHRYYRDASGTARSKTHYNADLFQRRYLSVFDEVEVLARVDGGEAGRHQLGANVTLVSLGDWNSISGLLAQRQRIIGIIDRQLVGECAVLMISPGTVGNILVARLVREHRPFGVEVVGNPADAMAAGAIHHPLRSLIRWSFCRHLKQICRHAVSAIYVTKSTLQQSYPPGESACARGCSDIELQEEAFALSPRAVQSQREWRLVHVGTMMQPYKAQDVLIDAVARCRSNNMNVTLTLLGDGALRPALELQVRRLGLENAVHFAGHLPPGQMVRWQLDQADLFVLPSRTEGLPRATLEAMARGLPCISTRVGGNPELLDAEELVPPGDAEALAERIRQVLSDPARMTRLSQRNLQLAHQYRYELLREQRLEAYRHLRDTTEAWLHGFRFSKLESSHRRAA